MNTAEYYWSPEFDLEFLQEEAVFAASRREVEIGNVAILLVVDRVVTENVELGT